MRINNLKVISALVIVSFFIPLLLAVIAIEQASHKYNDYLRITTTYKGYQELENFNNKLSVESYLHKAAGKIDQLSKHNSFAKNKDTTEIKQAIEKELGLKTLAIYFFNEDLSELASARNLNHPYSTRTMPPAPLMRRVCQFLNTHYAPSDVHEVNEYNTARNSAAIYTGQLFNTVTPVNLEFGKVNSSFSSSFGGELYFITKKLPKPLGKYSRFIIIIHGTSISPERIVSKAINRHPECGILVGQNILKSAYKSPADFVSGISESKNEILLRLPANSNFLRHYNQLGTIDVQRLKKPYVYYYYNFGENPTFLQEILANIKSLLLVSFGLFLIINARFALKDGLSLKSFRKKLLIVTIISSIFPFSIFASSYYINHVAQNFLTQINVRRHIMNQLTQTGYELTAYINRLEASLKQLTNEHFTHISQFDEQKAVITIEQIAKKIPLSRAIIYTEKESVTHNISQRLSEIKSTFFLDFYETFFPYLMLRSLTSNPFNDRTDQLTTDMGQHRIRVSRLNDFLLADGSLYYNYVEGIPNYYSTHLVKIDSLDTVVIYVFEPGPILKDFYESHYSLSDSFQESFAGHKILYSFIPNDSTGADFIWPGHASAQKSLYEQEPAVIHEVYNSFFPHTARGTAYLSNTDSFTRTAFSIVFAGLVYLTTLFTFCDLLIKEIFVNPVLSVAQSAKNIAKGSQHWDTQLNTGDEFESLNQSFINMVRGLKQKNLLKDFISTDAMHDIETSHSGTLSPGGDYETVSVLFISIKNYEQTTKNMKPNDVVNLLNNFISIADKSSKKYSGTIDKIIDNTIMIIFRQNPLNPQKHCIDALRAAQTIKNEALKQNLKGILAGIASGQVILGRIGSHLGRLDYTVIGDTVNLAARLKQEASSSEGGIILSGITMKLLKGKARVRFLRRRKLKGKSREYNIYELVEFRQ